MSSQLPFTYLLAYLQSIVTVNALSELIMTPEKETIGIYVSTQPRMHFFQLFVTVIAVRAG